MNNQKSLGVLGKLLEELSWTGSKIKEYRNGGIGYENVLTAEVFQSLNFLPREHFLGEIIKSLNSDGDVEQVRNTLAMEIENTIFTLLPGNIYLKPSGKSHQTKYGVQPDGIIETNNVFCLVEAKRIRTSSFQPRQLSREFVTALRESEDRKPLLLLILGKEPPVLVAGQGRKEIKKAIIDELDDTLLHTENFDMTHNQVVELIDNSVAWITWDQIQEIVQRQLNTYESSCNSTKSCISRLGNEIIDSIERHR